MDANESVMLLSRRYVSTVKKIFINIITDQLFLFTETSRQIHTCERCSRIPLRLGFEKTKKMVYYSLLETCPSHLDTLFFFKNEPNVVQFYITTITWGCHQNNFRTVKVHKIRLICACAVHGRWAGLQNASY